MIIGCQGSIIYTSSNQAIAISKSNNPLNMCLFIILFNYWIAILSISDVSGLIIFYGQILTFIAGIYGWSRDLVRETIKKCNMVSVNVFIFGFTPFVISESILFISIFWGLIHFISSPFFNFQESLFLPDPCELTYGNTLLLVTIIYHKSTNPNIKPFISAA